MPTPQQPQHMEIDRRYGRLTIRAWVPSEERGQRRTRIEVECACGTVFTVRPTALTSQGTVSCGCYHREASRARLKALWAAAKAQNTKEHL